MYALEIQKKKKKEKTKKKDKFYQDLFTHLNLFLLNAFMIR